MAKERSGGQQQTPQRQGEYPLRVAIGPADLFRMGPFSLMRRMSEEMDRALGRVPAPGEEEPAAWVPVIEISEREGNYVVRADLPGVKPGDVKLEITGEAIILQGERKVEQEREEGGIHLTERRYGRFYRSIPLPEGAKVDEARARYENGVLEIMVPMEAQRSQRREIPIEPASRPTGGTEKAA